MYSIEILGDGVMGQVMARLCQRSGYNDVTISEYAQPPATTQTPALTLGANQTRILQALGLSEPLLELSICPDREQVRLAKSRYLVSELPLGQFYRDRYGAPMLNLEHHDLSNIVATNLTGLLNNKPLLTIETETSHHPDPDWALLYAAQPATPTGGSAIANITWLAPNAIAWQFWTRSAEHLYVLKPSDQELQAQDWHPSLWERIQSTTAVPLVSFEHPLREHWAEGDHAFMGHACLPCHPVRRETWFTGLEDAWVLSRMIENYEEAVGEALSAYQQYRRPRSLRILRSNNELWRTTFSATRAGRVARNIGIGLRSRFLPEIAMQRIDWLYGYDCIKGFH